jgi:hypothetical protein
VIGGGTPTAARNSLVEHLARGCYQASDAEAGTVVHHDWEDLCPEWAGIGASSSSLFDGRTRLPQTLSGRTE